jgi:O-antigen ligase
MPDPGTDPSAGASSQRRQISNFTQSDTFQHIAEIGAPLAVGLALGAVVVFATRLPSDWANLVLLAALAPTVAILGNDLRKLLLVLFIAAIPLGLDFEVLRRTGPLAGPAGIWISPVTLGLVVGYAWWLLKRPAGGREEIHAHPEILIPAFFYILAVLVSSFQATELWFSITQFLLEFQLLLLFVLVVNQIRTWADVRFVFSLVVVCLLAESLVMLLEVSPDSIGGRRLVGTLSNPNLAGTYLAGALAIAFAAYLTDGRLANKRLALAAFTLGSVALVLTQSRSGLLAAAAAFVLLVVRAVARRTGGKAAILFLTILFVVGSMSWTIVTRRFSGEDSGSAESRVLQSELALNVLREHWLTGIGVNQHWTVVADEEYLPPELLGRELFPIHNVYLTVWVEIGIFGFLAFLWLLGAGAVSALLGALRATDRYVSIAMAGLLAALVAWLVNVLVQPWRPPRMLMLWLLLAIIAASCRIARETIGMQDPMRQTDGSQRAELSSLAEGSQ